MNERRRVIFGLFIRAVCHFLRLNVGVIKHLVRKKTVVELYLAY